MNKSVVSKVIEEIKEKKFDLEAEKFSSIGFTPSDSSSALLQILVKITRKNQSSILNANLSEEIASSIIKIMLSPEELKKAVEHVINKEGNEIYSKTSAVGLLWNLGFIDISDGSFSDIEALLNNTYPHDAGSTST